MTKRQVVPRPRTASVSRICPHPSKPQYVDLASGKRHTLPVEIYSEATCSHISIAFIRFG